MISSNAALRQNFRSLTTQIACTIQEYCKLAQCPSTKNRIPALQHPEVEASELDSLDVKGTPPAVLLGVNEYNLQKRSRNDEHESMVPRLESKHNRYG